MVEIASRLTELSANEQSSLPLAALPFLPVRLRSVDTPAKRQLVMQDGRHAMIQPLGVAETYRGADMTKRPRSLVASTVAVLVASLTMAGAAFQPAAPASSKTWIGRNAEIESYLKSAPVTGMEELKVGVTRPRRAKLAPGGPVEAMAWKAVKPGRYSGYWESYKSEIAAYELDKALELGMVPPTVEKQVIGETGAAVMWVSPTHSFK